MPGATWDSLFSESNAFVRKALYGSVLVQDYSTVNTNFANYSPFDPTTGLLSSTLLTTDGWSEIGLLDENGVEFTPTYTTTDTTAWQTRTAVRTDVTAYTEQAKIVALSSNALTDCLYNNVPLNSMPINGAAGYKFTKARVPGITYRSVLFVGVDGTTGNFNFIAKLYPKAIMIKPDKQDWQAKTEIQVPLTFEAYIDANTGTDILTYREGPGWRALGVPGAVTGVAASTTTGSGTVTWVAPVGGNAPTSYTVSVVRASDSLPTAGSPFTVAAPASSKAITATAATVYVASVTPVNSNGNGPTSSVTFTAA